jgi:hypothetical protein
MNSKKLAWLVFGAALALAGWFGFYSLAPEEPVWLGFLVGATLAFLICFAARILFSMPPGFRWLTVGAVIAFGAFWLFSQPSGEDVPWWIAGLGMFGMVWLYHIRDRGNLENLGRRDIWITLGLTVLLAMFVAGFASVGKYFRNRTNNNSAVEELIGWE